MSRSVRRTFSRILGLILGGLSATLLAAAACNHAPEIDSVPYPVAEVGQLYRYPVHATDPDGNAIAYSLMQGPQGMTYSTSAQAVQWTPTAAQVGTSTVKVQAKDSWAAIDQQSYSLRVVADFCEIFPITIPQQILATVQPGTSLGQIDRGTGSGNFSWLTWTGSTSATTLAMSLTPPGDSYAYVNPDNTNDRLLQIGDWAQGATGSMNSSYVRERMDILKTRDIVIPTWTSTRGQGSKFDYKVVHFASVRLLDYQLNGQGWLKLKFLGYKNCYNDAPVANPQTLSTKKNSALPLVLTGSDPESDTLSYSVVSFPAHGTLSGSGSNLAYAPATGYTGPDQFTFRTSDGEYQSPPATVSIQVQPNNDSPTASNLSLATDEDVPLLLTLQAMDPDGDPMVYRVLQAPAYGNLQGTGPTRTYVPNTDYYGPDSFTYVANDGALDSGEATVTILVRSANDPPTALSQQVQTDEDTALLVRLSSSDPEGDGVGFRIIEQPLHGRLDGAGGDWTYQPDPNYAGYDGFNFVSNDGQVDSSPARVDITIIDRNVAPHAEDLEYEVMAGSLLSITLSGSDPDGDGLNYRVIRLPSHGDIGGDAPEIHFLAGSDFSGIASFEYVVNDGRLDSRSATVSIRVLSAGPPKITTVPQNFSTERTIYQYDIDATDPDVDDTLSYSLDRFVGTNAIEEESGLVRWRPSGDFRGSVREINRSCRTPAPRSSFDPVLKWGRSGPESGSDLNAIFGPPLVSQLNDDNGDGRIDVADQPDVLVMSRTTSTSGAVIALSGNTGQTLWQTRLSYLGHYGTPAMGDIDDDGKMEIAVISARDGAQLNLLENDGSLKWSVAIPAHSAPNDLSRDAPLIADLDADGTPEIIRGATIVNADGTLRCTGANDKGGTADYAYIPIVADVDLDGKQELIAGRSIYSSQCQLVRQLGATNDGYTAVGNFDADPYPEIVLVSNGDHDTDGRLYIYKANGTRLAGPVAIPHGGAGGPPALANVDDDPYPEIGVAGRIRYVMFDNNGNVRWTKVTQDESSNQTGSTFFDFEGDGAPEIVYGDEQNVYFWDGRTGALRYSFANVSGTTMEYPVVTDIDGDHSADVIVGFNGSISGGIEGGLRVISSASRSWPDARPLWNQHAFSITNINDDGSIPQRPEPSWLAHNSFRLNALAKGQSQGMADLALFDLRLDAEAGSIHLTVLNRGLAATDSATLVRISDGSSVGLLLGTIPLPTLQPGESLPLHLDDVDVSMLQDSLYAVVDDVDAVAECAEGNNTVAAQIFRARVTDSRGMFDTQVFSVSVIDVNEAPSFLAATPGGARLGQYFTYDLHASDPDLGDGLTYTLVSGPAGMEVESVSGELRWTPNATQVGVVPVTVRVTDLGGLNEAMTFELDVPLNSAPVVTSEPTTEAIATQAFEYDVDANDIDGDIVSYSLIAAPVGMEINSVNGIIRWTPTDSQVGSSNIQVNVADPLGGTTTQSFTLVVTLPVNHPPKFDTQPVRSVALGQRYQYDARASDPDANLLTYGLQEGPTGMTVDTTTGTIVWQPRTGQVGEHAVRLRARDIWNAEAEQTFSILVTQGVDEGNHPPSIDSMPKTAILQGDEYEYRIVASDIDGDALSFALEKGPAGASFDAVTHRLAWAPTIEQVGLQEIHISVRDAHGAIARQWYTLLVTTTPVSELTGNHPPVIETTPLTRVALGQTYRYYATARDPDGDALVYSLVQAPSGMSVNETTGVVAWTPSSTGSVIVQLRADDGRGAAAMQTYVLAVQEADGGDIDHRPVLLSPPFGFAKVGQPYAETLRVADADGETVTYALLSGPIGAAIDTGTGAFMWTPSAAGNIDIVVRAQAGLSYTDIGWALQVSPSDTPLSVHLQVSPERVLPGGSITVQVGFEGAGSRPVLQADINGMPLALDADGSTALAAPTLPGYYVVTVQANDGLSLVSGARDLYIADPNDQTPPVASLTSPVAEAKVTAPTNVQGAVTGADVARWTLSLYDKASGSTVPISEGRGAAVQGTLGVLDPTLLVNGFHILVLRAWDNGGNEASSSHAVLIEGDMKIGHYSVNFEDISVPMAGHPLRVTRTYDTRERNRRMDFGYGWSVDYQSLRVTESRTPGFSWSLLQERNGYFANWCVRPNGDPTVAVTMPDGELLKFRAKASPECQFLVPQTDVKLVFEALPGTDAQLVQDDYQTLRLASVAGSGVYNLIDLSDPYSVPADPSTYRVKLPDGTIYHVLQGHGILELTEPDGNALVFTHDGVQHSRGPELRFLRDGQGRIEEIRLPDGGRRHYTYSNAGDLEMAVDEVGGITSFAYDARAPHYLRDIVDARGVRVSRNEYDEDGRLVATIDAEGHRIEYTHNLSSRSEILRDRRGNASTYVYDEQGRVTAESNALGETMLHSYDTFGNELSTTDPLGNITTRVFDERGNVLRETNPMGQVTSRTYSATNQLLTETDPTGRLVLKNTYHAYNGKLVSTTNALGETTSFEYDSGIFSNSTGELIRIVDAGNAVTRYEVNQFGHRVRQYDALGREIVHNIDLQGREHGWHRDRTLASGAIEEIRTRYELDAKGRVVATVHPDGSRTTVEYDGNDKPVRSCDALNRCTALEYDARGNLFRTTYPDGTQESSSYDANGNVLSRTDRGGRITKMIYDAADRLVETVFPDATPEKDADNPRTRSEYDSAGRMILDVDERGNRTRYSYDAAGRPTKVTDALGGITTTIYDVAGQRVAVTDALGRTTRFCYDAAGRLVETIYPDETPQSGDNPKTQTSYDRVGRKIAETDELGRIRRFVHDALGRLVSVVLPNPATGNNPELVKGQSPDAATLTTRYSYDELGSKLTQTDALGRVTRWTYDRMGRELSRALPMGQVERFGYDAAGQRFVQTDFNGVATRYNYDLAGRLAGLDHATDADVIITYTASGQRESITDDQGTTLYSYDARDRLLGVVYPDGGAIAYDYDAVGNRTGLHSTALDQDFIYDPLNRLSEVQSHTLRGSARGVRYGYDAVGNRTRLEHADGSVTTTTYDARNRLSQQLTRSLAGVLILGATYDLDASGARTGFSEFDVSGVTRSASYVYDGTQRLLSETIVRPGQTRTTSYVYDAVGNRLRRNEAGAVTTYVVDANDRLASETTGSIATLYTYDANGNTTSRARSGEVTSYGYDENDRLVRTESTGLLVETGYTADGMRNREVANGVGRTWLIDPNRDYTQTLETYRSGSLATVWIYGNELLSQMNEIGGGLHERHLQTDGFGSVRLATDVNGSITDRFEYDAFGTEMSRTGTSDIDHRYRSEQRDPSTGFYNLRARWYDTNTGRFTRMDPFEGFAADPATLHKYVGNHNDPANRVDPSGYASLTEMAVATNVNTVLRTNSVFVGRRTIQKILLGHPPKDIGVVGEMVLDWVLQGFYEHVLDGGVTKQEFGRRVHSDVKNRCSRFIQYNGVSLDCEPFFNEKGQVKGNPKGSLGVDVLIRYQGRPVVAFEIKTGKGMSGSGFQARRKYIGASVIQITLKPARK